MICEGQKGIYLGICQKSFNSAFEDGSQPTDAAGSYFPPSFCTEVIFKRYRSLFI